MTKEKIILGIDPGTNILGFGVIRVNARGPHYVDMGVFDLRKTTKTFSGSTIRPDKFSYHVYVHWSNTFCFTFTTWLFGTEALLLTCLGF